MLNDSVNHPKHYNNHPSGVECIEITRHMGFNLGNALKYIWRCDLKKDAIEDLKKAVWYLQDEIHLRQHRPPQQQEINLTVDTNLTVEQTKAISENIEAQLGFNKDIVPPELLKEYKYELAERYGNIEAEGKTQDLDGSAPSGNSKDIQDDTRRDDEPGGIPGSEPATSADQ